MGDEESVEDLNDDLHILLLTEEYHPTVSGGAHARTRFAQITSDLGHEISVITPKVKSAPRLGKYKNINVYRPFPVKPGRLPAYSRISQFTRFLSSFLFLLFALVLVEFKDIDGIHSTDHLFHWVASVISKVHALRHTSFVGYTPSIDATNSNHLECLFESLNFRFFMGNIAYVRNGEIETEVESDEVKRIGGILNKDKIMNVLKCSNMEPMDLNKYFSDGKSVLIYCGRFSPLKRPEEAVRVLHALSEDYRLIMIGDGPEMKTVKNLIENLDESDRIYLTGRIDHENALSIISRADGLLLMSQAESYPTVVFEALVYNTEVFATPVGILTDLQEKRLHLCRGDFVQKIKATTFSENKSKFNQRVLDEYSLEKYTKTILDDFTG